jgi:hypothetical protein
MEKYPVDQERLAAIEAEILQLIEGVVKKHIDNPEARELVVKSQSEGYKVGKYIIKQIPYASLDDIDFPPLPMKDGREDPLGETERVQRFGPLQYNWTEDPFVQGGDDERKQRAYATIPVGFPALFGEKRYPQEGFDKWRQHNGLKALRFEYVIFPGKVDYADPTKRAERPAHIIVMYSGGDH